VDDQRRPQFLVSETSLSNSRTTKQVNPTAFHRLLLLTMSLSNEGEDEDMQSTILPQKSQWTNKPNVVTSPSSYHPRPPPVSRNTRVIIAEDENEILKLYTHLLSRAGFNVTRTFDNGRDLAEFVSNNTVLELEPDVIVTDLRMPRMDGVEATRTIRATKPKMKIILASAYDLPEDAASLFDAILRKPFGSNELVDTVSRCVNHNSFGEAEDSPA